MSKPARWLSEQRHLQPNLMTTLILIFRIHMEVGERPVLDLNHICKQGQLSFFLFCFINFISFNCLVTLDNSVE